MMGAALEVRLAGEPAGISERAYTSVLNELTRALEDLDRVAEPRPTARPVWAVTHTSWSSTGGAVVRLTPRLRSGSTRTTANILRPSTELWGGISSLALVPEIPQMFTESIIERVTKVRHQIERPRSGLATVSILSLVTPTGSTPAEVSEAVEANAQAAIAAASLSYGSLTGRLDVISARGRYKKIGLRSDFGPPVTCNVDRIQQSDLFELFDQRVVAAGLLRRNASGQAVRLDVDSLELLPASALISASSLLGALPDLGGDLSALDYVRMRRGK